MSLLDDDQRGFFARNGFLHVRGLIKPDTCSKLVDHTWTRLPRDWQRDRPASWDGVVPDSCHTSDVRTRRGHLQFQKGDLLGHPVIEAAFASTAVGGELAQELIGHKLARMRVRGLYCIVPLPPSVTLKGGRPHIESHAAQLVALCYLEDVEKGGGGLSVWPGSHREVYPAMGSKLEHVPTPAYDAVFDKWARLRPVEIPGKCGDVVIIHHRLLHAPSLNRSSRMRYGFLCDYQRDDFRRLSTEHPGADLWEDWPAMARLRPWVRDAAPDYVLQPVEGFADVVPLHARRLSATNGRETNPSNVRKSDASALARSRRDGDVWLALSDEACTADDTELFPRGSELGVSVRVDGKTVASVCRYDFFARLDLGPGEHVVEIEGLDRQVWLRVLSLRLPFIRSSFLARQALSPGRAALKFHVAVNPIEASH